MKKLMVIPFKWRVLILMGFIMACVKDRHYGIPPLDCISIEEVTIGMEELRALYRGETVIIQEDFLLEGYVVSSDKAGNFFAGLYIQDKPVNPSAGIHLQIDLRDSHLFFPPGSRVVIKLKGLYYEEKAGAVSLGGVFEAFGNKSVGRLPAAAVGQHLFLACEAASSLQPHSTTAGSLADEMLNTLVQLQGMEIIADYLGTPFAPPAEEVTRTMQNCEGATVQLLNSGYADFRDWILPDGNGTATGVLVKGRMAFQLKIRDTTDLQFHHSRCDSIAKFQSTRDLFISEIADPDNNADARYIELYYAGEPPLSLNQWVLQRYTNDSTEPGSVIDLSGQQLLSNSCLIIAANAGVFEATYGFQPHLEGGRNSPADSNGDDTLELLGPDGERVDIFGVVGEDGSGTNHEFEDGGAWRREFVNRGSPLYTFEEWEVFNDSGLAGTQLRTGNAPEDYSPGIR